jgi:hypothetical protein
MASPFRSMGQNWLGERTRLINQQMPKAILPYDRIGATQRNNSC